MAPVVALSASARSCTVNRRLPARATVAVPRPTAFLVAPVPRSSIIRFSSDTGAENDDQLVGENGEILQGHRDMGKSSPMSEDKKAQTPEQGGAPEGDRAVAGQAYQPTGDNSDVTAPEAGDVKSSQSKQGAGETAREEGQQQEERAPLQD